VADDRNREDQVPAELLEQAERLTEAGERYRSSIPVPDQIDLYIERGIRDGKRRVRTRSSWRYGGLTAAALLLVFVLGLRVSPTLAAAVSQIPGLDYLVNLVRSDRSLEMAVENDYIQPVGKFDEHDGVRFTIDGVIADAHRMEILYSLQSLEDAEVEITGFTVQDADEGQPLTQVYLNQGLQGHVGVYFMEDVTLPKRVAVEVGVKTYPAASAHGTPLQPKETPKLPERWQGTYPVPDGIWRVEFEVDQERFLGMQQEYELGETVTVQGQRITFTRAIVHPIGVSVKVEIDPDNTMEIFGLELDDLRLINEKGESYRSYMRYDGDYYFESPYFAMPEELYIEGRRVRAFDKNRLEVELDLAQRKIVKAPNEQLTLEDIIEHEDSYELIFRVYQPPGDTSMSHIFQYEFRDAAGQRYQRMDGSHATKSSMETFTRNYVKIPKADYEGNLIFQVTSYPSYIESPFRIRIK